MDIIYGKTDCAPAETGYDASRLDKLNERLADMIDRRVIHGASYCISHKGKVIAHAALGRNNSIGENTPMRPDTVFDIASITKVFTATAIMQLVEDGVLNLNDPAGKYLPPLAKEPFSDIKLIHLLTHTSGLYPDAGCFDENYSSAWELIEKASAGWDGKGDFDWITPAVSTGMRRKAGEEWQYCSFAFALLGEIISRVSGVNVHSFIENGILKPLLLDSTGFYLNADTAGRMFLYDEKFRSQLAGIASGKIDGRRPSGTVWDKIPGTAGGLTSTVSDLVRFGNAFIFGGRLDGARLLGRKSVEKMAKVQISGIPDRCWGATEDNRLYGVGFDIRRTPSFCYSDNTIMHEGAGASSLDIDLDEQLCAAWFVPFDVGADGWSPEPLYNVQNIIWSGII